MTGKLNITPYQALVIQGSDISNPQTNSGYQPALVHELHRVSWGNGCRGGTITVDAQGARDLRGFANDLANAVAQEPNPPGARSLAKLADRAWRLARDLEGGDR